MFCVYLTEYFGNKMPSKYIGSTSLDRIKNGYKGSVSSKKYKSLWIEELKNNPHLFKTTIISTHETRKEALYYELINQIECNIPFNDNYINQSLAVVNGFFGKNMSGNNNPMYGKSRKNEKHAGGENISRALKLYYSTESGKLAIKNLSKKMSGNNHPMYGKNHSKDYKLYMSELMKGINNPMYGKKHTEESKLKIKNKKMGNIPWNKNKTGIYSEEILDRMRKPKTEEHKNKIKKSYIFVSPEGKKYSVFGLIEFCQQFNLNKGAMSEVWSEKRKTHKGWTKYYE